MGQSKRQKQKKQRPDQAGGKRKNKGATRADKADRHALYEQAVQCVEAEIDFVDTTFTELRGREARYLREDFCGTGNTSCEWVRRRRGNYATGIDLDTEVLAWGEKHHVETLSAAERKRIALLEGNVMDTKTSLQDVVLAMNFSYWLFKERADLTRYFRRVRDSLVDDGVFFLDCYGGYDAFRELKEKTRHDGFTYVWDQASYNPVDGNLVCHIHFRFPDGSQLKKAFTYDWRLWTMPEVREVLKEAGFSRTIVYWQGWDEDEEAGSGEFEAVESADADAGWIAYIAAIR